MSYARNHTSSRISGRKRKPTSAFSRCVGAVIGDKRFLVLLVLVAGLCWEINRTIEVEVLDPLLETFAEGTPRTLPSYNISQTERQALHAKLDRFAAELQAGTAEPLSLNTREVNALIESSPELSQKVSVRLNGDVARADVSIPVSGSKSSARYINGHVAFTVFLISGKLDLRILDMQVGQQKLPEEFLERLKLRNLGERAMEDPDVQQVFAQLRSVSLRGGQLTLFPRYS